MEGILSWVKSGLLFGVFASVILMLSPNKSYQKHIGMVIGMLFILVMLHPVMVIFNQDKETYVSFIRNFLMIENNESSLNENDIPLYEKSVEAQLKAVFLDRGYPVSDICVRADRYGNIFEVTLSFTEDGFDALSIDKYIKRLFGEGVTVRYEAGQ